VYNYPVESILIYSIYFAVLVPFAANTILHLGAAIAFIKDIQVRRKFSKTEPDKLPKLSLLVPAKDEEQNLPTLIESLEKQIHDFHQIILINDRSEDGTASIMDEFSRKYPEIVIALHVKDDPKGSNPKLEALKRGEKLVSGDVLCITDADCEVPRDWANCYRWHFADSNAGMVAGAVVCRMNANPISWYHNGEHIFRSYTMAGCIGMKIAGGAFGNNLAIRFSTLQSLGGLSAVENSPTEDAALVSLIRSKTNLKIRALGGASGTVITEPVHRKRDLFKQLKRWQIGGLRSSDLWSRLSYGFLMWFFFFAMAVLPLGFFMTEIFLIPLALYIALVSLIFMGIMVFGQYYTLVLLPLLAFLTWFVNGTVTFYAKINRNVEWKGTQIEENKRKK
jgi:cellulose synthase/poly-beta-1,6-N-acetylglucosamine synthase-like glycosyltransferase